MFSISPTTRVWIAGHQRTARQVVEALVSEALRPAEGPVDCAILVPETADECSYFARKILPRLTRDGCVCVATRRDDDPAVAVNPSDARFAALRLVEADRFDAGDGVSVVRFVRDPSSLSPRVG